MQKLLSLPPNLVEYFHEIEQVDHSEWYCTSDPIGKKLGSGGGTTWLLEACRNEEAHNIPFNEWLGKNKRILLHAGGQSRRLPGYAPSGKILTPLPVFRWARGQKLRQNLLSLQLPLYEAIMRKTPKKLNTLIASGDVYIRVDGALQAIPEADVVCYGLWVDPSLAKNHGVFIQDRQHPDALDFMLQKPSVEELSALMQTHYFLMDIGIWLLSDRAVELLCARSKMNNNEISYYDLYSDFGLTLGAHPRIHDPELNQLTVAILPLQGGQFYHYGTSRELISSTLSVQNIVNDQRAIMHHKIKPHPAMFVQNSDVRCQLTETNSELWVENSVIGARWILHDKHLITGVPDNDWTIELPSGVCLDIVPIAEEGYAVRPYGYNDAFKGDLHSEKTLWMGVPVLKWFVDRGIHPSQVDLQCLDDLQAMALFPVVKTVDHLGILCRWMISEPDLMEGKRLWMESPRLSADQLSASANLRRLNQQRDSFRALNWPILAKNFEKSVFYQLNLDDAAAEFAKYDIPAPNFLPETVPLMTRIHDQMFRARMEQFKGLPFKAEEEKAFSLLREGLTAPVMENKQHPRLDIFKDQIVWGRSPVRIDLAGGWTDTPPYCLNEGGNVVNIAIELNGQPPLQVYIKSCCEKKVILRSIDLGAREELTTYDELLQFNKVGSPFSIPKAALVLAGFSPRFSAERYPSLQEQLNSFGSGIEITLLSAVPAGSGLGTSSILASTVLGAISDFCSLAWDKNEICQRTLVLEQLLTTGGGWQDQYGGVLQGVKLLQTNPGFNQSPLVRWLPEYLFTQPEYQKCHLLYYTGLTRTAKGILAEIVRGMFLNSTTHLSLLHDMKSHALDLYEAIQRGNFEETGKLVGKSWEQNKQLDAGTNPPEVEAIIRQIKDYCLGYKLPGAGGGGFLYMVAKDPEAAARIKNTLNQNQLFPGARFVGMSLSEKGLQISRS
ncbi:MAG: bifunctional fucokinase/fucose-1-phosphate guanylyltransferase [Bacteroidales bacterium]|nr:bifunctional fucokinase/fucose-1-phosphate guanylyltransferase [Bacteroidales bacterium]